MGTDVLKLVDDGYPANLVAGCDLRRAYIDLGYKLYRDEYTCPIHFFTSDIFDLPLESSSVPTASLKDVSSLADLVGRVSYIYTGALFHLFDKDTQYAIALRLALLLNRNRGSVVFGRHQGKEPEGYIDDHLGRCDIILVLLRARLT